MALLQGRGNKERGNMFVNLVNTFKKIYSVLVLLFNVLVRRSKYKLSFVSGRINDRRIWHYNFRNWGFDSVYLMMIDGADEMCEEYCKGKDCFSINVVVSKKPRYDLGDGYDAFEVVQPSTKLSFLERLVWGRSYSRIGNGDGLKTMWICPVALFVFGRYPNYIYAQKKIKK